MSSRTWILIKALLLWIHTRICRWRQGRSLAPGRRLLPSEEVSSTSCNDTSSPLTRLEDDHYQLLPLPPADLLDSNMSTIGNSHSELGAARNLLQSLWLQINEGALTLSEDSNDSNTASVPSRRTKKKYARIFSRYLENCQRHLAEIALSIFLFTLFCTIFVAESAGSVLSAIIVGDTTALIQSSRCAIPPDSYAQSASLQSRAAAYADRCYDSTAENRQAGNLCNYYYNQSLAYKTKSNATCPFAGQTCAQGRSAAFALDTGYIDASYLGFNSGRRLTFRRETTCAPLLADNEFIIARNPREGAPVGPPYSYYNCSFGRWGGIPNYDFSGFAFAYVSHLESS